MYTADKISLGNNGGRVSGSEMMDKGGLTVIRMYLH